MSVLTWLRENELVMFKQDGDFYIGKIVAVKEDYSAFEVEKPYIVQPVDERQLPPDVREQMRSNPGSIPLGLAAHPLLTGNRITVSVAGCGIVLVPSPGVASLYMKRVSNLILPPTHGKIVL